MIIVENLTGATSYTQRFECSASKLGFSITAAQKSDVEGVSITLVVVDANGQQKVITPRTNLRDLMEIAASNEGMVQIKDNYTSTTLTTVNYLATIELSNFGSIDLAGGYGQIQIDGAVSTTVWNIYGIDNPSLTSMIIKYEPIWAAANQYKQCDISDAYAIAIPKSNLVELQLQYTNGRTIIYKPTELELIAQEINELAEVEQNIGNTGATLVVVGGNKLYCLGVKSCVGMRIQYTSATTFYKVSDAVLQ